MARFRMLEAAYVQPTGQQQSVRVRAGTAIALSGVPPIGAMPLDDDARAAYAAMLQRFRKSHGRQDWGNRIGSQSAIKIAKALGENLTSDNAASFIMLWLEQQEKKDEQTAS